MEKLIPKQGSQASGTSKKNRAKTHKCCQSKLLLDYEDLLRQNRLTRWKPHDPRRQELIDQRFEHVDEVAKWAGKIHMRDGNPLPEAAANAILILVEVSCGLLRKQITTLADDFTKNGGITERLYRVRSRHRS